MRAHSVENMAPHAKGRSWKLPEIPKTEGREALFDAVLSPNRSLPNKGFTALMLVIIFLHLTLGVVFYTLGAWPVLGFFGLDVVVVWLAFKMSYRQGLLHERVCIDKNSMWVARVLPSGHETRWRLRPFWTQIAIEGPNDHELRVRVTTEGRSLLLGSFLSPAERRNFGEALRAALAHVRIVRD